MSDDLALIELLRLLRNQDYQFTTVTPATHARVLSRPQRCLPDIRDIFGWNRSFTKDDLEPRLLKLLERADVLDASDGSLRSKVRVASCCDHLFLHSAFPTENPDAVFFGPDTYRFIRFVKQQLPTIGPLREVVDMGAGSGAGAISIANTVNAEKVTLVDVNDSALGFARVNAAFAELEVSLVNSSTVPVEADLVIANPPYLMDEQSRQYRDGGDLLGGAVALDWTEQFLSKPSPGRSLVLYTGAAYQDGRSPLLVQLAERCRAAGATISIAELDPDVFGDELGREVYHEVERIAAVGIRIDR